MIQIFSTALLVILMWLTTVLPVRAGDGISSDEFRQIRTLVMPDPVEEKWAQIPWLSSLWEARKQAAAEGKPILLWEMDGHPLGCT